MSENEQPEEAVFEAALHLAADQRAAYLDRACADNSDLRRRVEALLAAFDRADGFLNRPAVPAFAGPKARPVPVSEKVGDKIGRYKLLQQIGEGGCGVVYMAEQEEPVRRRVALKIIKLGMDTKQVIARFDAERQALAMMDHPNIAKVLDASATDAGRPYFVMELVRGIKITEFCDENKLSTADRLKLFIPVCQAIQHAHQKSVIHRDIKPSNVLVTINDGVPVPKVIDFGIAKATAGRLTDQTLFTAFEQFIGTPAYMSPEQAVMTSLDVDTRTDVYSLGVMLYELLTGSTPFDQSELLKAGLDEMRRTIRETDPPRPSMRLSTMAGAALTTAAQLRHTEAPRLIHLLRGDLDWIVMKCLEKDRARRYESASGLAMDIQCHLDDEPVTAGAPSRLYRFQKLVRRNKLAVAASCAVALTLVIGLGISTWQFFVKSRALRRATEAEQGQIQLRQTAETEARRAEATARELSATLSANDFLQAARLVADDVAVDALPYLTRSLSVNPDNDAALTRLMTLLTYRSWWVPSSITARGSVEFDPEFNRFVTISDDGVVRVREMRTSEPATELARHSTGVVWAQFSRDGGRLFTVEEDNTVHVWDAKTGQPLSAPVEYGASERPKSISPNGEWIATIGEHNEVSIWDVQTRGPIGEPIPQSDTPIWLDVLFSPDGKLIVTTSWADGTARVWDTLSGKPLTGPMKPEMGDTNTAPAKSGSAYSGIVGYVTSADGSVNTIEPIEIHARFSPDGRRVILAGTETVQMFDVGSGKPISVPMQYRNTGSSVRFSPLGNRMIAMASVRYVYVLDVVTGRPVGRPIEYAEPVSSVEFSPDGRRIVTASGRIAHIWDAETGSLIGEPMTHWGAVQAAWFAPDGKQVITKAEAGVGSFTISTWEPWTDARPLNQTGVDRLAGRRMDVIPDGKRLVTYSGNTAQVWDTGSGQPVGEPLRHERRLDARLSPDGTKVVTSSLDETVRVWDAGTGRPQTEPLSHPGIRELNAWFGPDGRRIVTVSATESIYQAQVWDAQSGGKVGAAMQHPVRITSAQFSPDGKWIATTARDETVRFWDAGTGELLSEPSIPTGTVNSIKFSPDGNRILTAGRGTVQVWDLPSGRRVGELIQQGERVPSASFSPNGAQVVTILYGDPTVRVWDVATGEKLAELETPSDRVVGEQFSPDGRRLLTDSGGILQIWDLETGLPVAEWRDAQQGMSIGFSSDGQQILTVATDLTLVSRVVAPPALDLPDWLLPLADAVSGRTLSSRGLLEPTKLDRVETLNEIQLRLAGAPDDDEWVIWGREHFADRATNTPVPAADVVGSPSGSPSARRIHHYTFNEGTFTDLVGDLDGSLEGVATISTGSLNLSGGTGELNAEALGINAYDSVSIEIWATSDREANEGNHVLFGMGELHPQWSTYYAVNYVSFTPDCSEDVLRGTIATKNRESGMPWLYESGVSVPDSGNGNEHHYVLTISGPAQQIELFVDGVSMGTAGTRQKLGDVGTEIASLGLLYPQDKPWQGSINEFAIYEGALTASEVAEAYARGPVESPHTDVGN